MVAVATDKDCTMDTMLLTERTLTDLDHARLKRLLAGTPAGPGQASIAALRAAMDNADLVPSRTIPPDVVTMYSRVVVVESTTRRDQVLFPADGPPPGTTAAGGIGSPRGRRGTRLAPRSDPPPPRLREWT